jgi:hypothetical protein
MSVAEHCSSWAAASKQLLKANSTVHSCCTAACLLLQMPPKKAVLSHIDEDGPRPARKARALLVMGKANPPVVREVLVTLSNRRDGKVEASNMENSNIHSSNWATVPYNQRPHGVMDQVG